MQGLTTEIVTITPDDAVEMLEANVNNRKIRQRTVEQFAQSMRKGEWVVNGEAIKFDHDGKLSDGQHRLWACVEAGVAFTTLVVRGVSAEAQGSMDQGVKRTLADTLRWKGETNVHQLASLLRLVAHFYDKGIVNTQQIEVYTKDYMLRFLDEHPDLRDATSVPHSNAINRLLTPSLGSALYYLFGKVDQADADEFFKRLATGESLEAGNPILALRSNLERNLAKPHSKMSARHMSALTIKAWNTWRKGNQLKLIGWKPGGAAPEPYPRIDGFEYANDH